MKNTLSALIFLISVLGLMTACSDNPGVNNAIESNLPNSPTASVKIDIHLEEKAQTFLSQPRDASSSVFIVDEKSKETYTDLKNSLSELYSIRELNDNRIRVDEVNVQLDLSCLESDRNPCGKKMVKNVMPSKYADQFMLYSTDTEYFASFDGEKATSGVSGYTFNFKRVFEGRVVRNTTNYLMVDTDADGKVKSFEVSLQHFKTTTESVATNASAEENIAALDSVLRMDFAKVKVVDTNGTVVEKSVSEAKVTSMAEAYCEVFHGNDIKLLPCLSYVVNMSVSDSNSIVSVVDVAHSRSSWYDYEHGKSFFRFDPRHR